jgi:hypothetical protein
MNKKQQTHNPSRRNFLKKTAYVTPVILTLPATPALATTGSCCQPQTKGLQGQPKGPKGPNPNANPNALQNNPWLTGKKI